MSTSVSPLAQGYSLTQRMPMGCVVKAHVAYARPFWRDRGLTGLVLSDRTEFGPWFDHSPSSGAGGLVGFFDGGPALVEPVGRLHRAGTETADAWVGYIDGAIRSGERVAREVSSRL